MTPGKILIADDEISVRDMLARGLRSDGYEIWNAGNGESALTFVRNNQPDLVLLDLYMPGMPGIDVLPQILKICPSTRVIIMTGRSDLKTAIQAMKLGASDYLEKPVDFAKLRGICESLLGRGRQTSGDDSNRKIVGQSPQLRETWEQIDHFAVPDISIMLLGESGTGKELFARAIHERSKRKRKAFVAIDCSTLPDTLVESEIFGHEKGAFTGAVEKRIGKFESANEGTLFLDEIGNLTPQIQMKLLRAIQERNIEPLGGRRLIPIDVRIISATNLDLSLALGKGDFRSDLYYRLAEVVITLPPLRERQGDVAVLANYFVEEFNRRFHRQVGGISDQAWRLLLTYPWPGNVRELASAIKSSILKASDFIEVEHLPEYLRLPWPAPPQAGQCGAAFREAIRQNVEEGLRDGFLDLKALVASYSEEIEHEILTAIMERKSFTQGELSKFLQVDPKTLRIRLQKFDPKAH